MILASLISFAIAHFLGLGGAVAAVVSYDRYKSPVWAGISGIFGWFYVAWIWVFGHASYV